MESLRRELEAAARAEDFEAAARLRDEIARLEASLNPS
ncbi:MAG: UvrB/UvrC motif-containing protein [Verrucomicrobiota bacterium]